MKLKTDSLRIRPRIEMLPLIDIVFLLLVFFIYAMLSMAVHRGMPVELPTTAAGQSDRETLLSVTCNIGSLGSPPGYLLTEITLPLKNWPVVSFRRPTAIVTNKFSCSPTGK